MTQPLTHLYELALHILEDQERHAHELRSRVTPVLGAGGVGATLLAATALHGASAGRPFAFIAAAAGVIGIVAALLAAGYLLKAHPLTQDLDADRSMRMLARAGLLDDADVFYTSMIVSLGKQRNRGNEVIHRLRTAFTVMQCGILLELCGLALAATLR